MTFIIAAAGTGGHVFPGLAVGEALVDLGVDRDHVLFVGGDRIEATVYPEAGFPFLGLELRGLRRSLSPKNLGLPRLLWRARDSIRSEIRERGVRVVLGLGGYVTIPAALAAHAERATLMIAEQNAGAGLANRVTSRWAKRVFVSFPGTRGLERGEWVGNPVRRHLAHFDRPRLRPRAIDHYRLRPDLPTLGVFGGSLGAAALNAAADDLAAAWRGPSFQMVQISGRNQVRAVAPVEERFPRRRVEFEDHMELFYAVCDLVVARAGGGVAELTATRTPSILIPGQFGSSGHQTANAAFLESHGAALVLAQDQLTGLGPMLEATLFDRSKLEIMAEAAASISKPDAAMTIASAMTEDAT
jgi:UDP-N-acetylglucosamine--N-acetylmuramyl-(pentapeptide) pyrophosphoryl-undecaprenol N-acetylglucosamine transferase